MIAKPSSFREQRESRNVRKSRQPDLSRSFPSRIPAFPKAGKALLTMAPLDLRLRIPAFPAFPNEGWDIERRGFGESSWWSLIRTESESANGANDTNPQPN